jgi:hypothetical protein
MRIIARRQLEPHRVAIVACEQSALHCGIDHVVRRAGEVRQVCHPATGRQRIGLIGQADAFGNLRLGEALRCVDDPTEGAHVGHGPESSRGE